MIDSRGGHGGRRFALLLDQAGRNLTVGRQKPLRLGLVSSTPGPRGLETRALEEVSELL